MDVSGKSPLVPVAGIAAVTCPCDNWCMAKAGEQQFNSIQFKIFIVHLIHIQYISTKDNKTNK